MKTYRNEKLGFEIDAPDEWSPPKFGASQVPFGESIVFGCTYFEAFNFQIGLLCPEQSLEQTEKEFRGYVQRNNYSALEFGRIMVEGKEHIWARYYLGGGRWNKKYLLVLSGIEYAITATCFYQNMLLEREKIWDTVVGSFHMLTFPDSDNRIETLRKATESFEANYGLSGLEKSTVVPDVEKEHYDRRGPQESPKSSTEPGIILEEQYEFSMGENTLAFSIISYALIASLALIYIHFKVGFDVLFSSNSESHSPLSNFELIVVSVIMIFGIGAFVCLMFLLGVVGNSKSLNNTLSFFGFIERTMQIHDKQKETTGGFIFSDYTRRPKSVVDALRLQVTTLMHSLNKIFVLPFSMVQLHLVLMLVFVIYWILPKFILRRLLPVSWDATYFLFLFYFCYRAFLFETAKRNGVLRAGDINRKFQVISNPSLDSSIQSVSDHGVTTDFIEKILSQQMVIDTIKNDLMKTGYIGDREVWRLGLITPDQDRFDPRLYQLSRQARMKLFFEDPKSVQIFSNLIQYKRTAVLHSTSFFNIQFNNILIANGVVRHSAYPLGWGYPLGTRMNKGEYIRFRDIQVEHKSLFTENRSRDITQFLREDGFPLKKSYLDGDPLTSERGGIIVIDKGKLMVIFPRCFVQRRIIDDEGNLVDIGVDEDFGHSVLEVKMQPSVADKLVQHVSSNGYVPVLRYHSFPYASDFMLPILDTPMSTSGWADLFIDTAGKAKLFFTKEKTLAEWYEMMSKLKQLFYDALAKKDYHFLGFAKDKTLMNQYLAQKQEILKEYYIIQNWSLF